MKSGDVTNWLHLFKLRVTHPFWERHPSSILVGDQKISWCRQDFALPARDKSVKTLWCTWPSHRYFCATSIT